MRDHTAPAQKGPPPDVPAGLPHKPSPGGLHEPHSRPSTWGGLVPGIDEGHQEAWPTGEPPHVPEPAPVEKKSAQDEQTELLRELRALGHEQRGLVAALFNPGRLYTVTFHGSSAAVPSPLLYGGTANATRVRNNKPGEGQWGNSIGIINPTAAHVFMGLGGARPTSVDRAVPIAPTSWLMLPISVEDLELGMLDSDLGANDAAVYLIRCLQVQPMSGGKLS